jgi:hypothetical protein
MTFVSSSFTPSRTTNFGSQSNRSPNQNPTFQTQRTGTQFGTSPNPNQRTSTNFNSSQSTSHPSLTRSPSNSQINPPVLTMGLNFPNPCVDISCILPDGQTGSLPCQIHNIVEIPIFSSYISEELRYFDYLRNGFAVSTIQSTPGVSSFSGQSSGQTSSTLSATGSAASSYSVDPWRHIPPELRIPTD